MVEEHLGIQLSEPAKSGLKNNDKNLTCINLYVFILQQVNSGEKKKIKRGDKGKAHLMLVISEKKNKLFSVIAVKGVQISAGVSLNRAQQCLHFT